jgi:Domain of unknown function (4846)
MGGSRRERHHAAQRAWIGWIMDMRRATISGIVTAGVALGALAAAAHAQTTFPWPASSRSHDTLATRFQPPPGFARAALPGGSFAAWLRDLPLRVADAPVRLHTGALKPRQDVHAAVIDIDTGARDLQQCADAVMRLRAEWQYAVGRGDRIRFNDTGGAKPMSFARWSAGERPRLAGKALHWAPAAAPDASYASFRRYLDTVFVWAGTHSLERELQPVSPHARIAIGDVIIKGGFPGHAVLVADRVEHPTTGEERLLLVQSYMPAQDIHVLIDPTSSERSPWFSPPRPDAPFMTPEWTFPHNSTRRFAD